MTNTERALIAFLRAAVGAPALLDFAPDYPSLFLLAQAHGVANLLYYALPKLPEAWQPAPPIRRRLKEAAFTAATRETIRQKELEAVFHAFGAAGIRFLPLKGCVVREVYPNPEMRTMSDADLLIDPEQAEAAKICLERMGFQTKQYASGDTDFYISPSNMNYEIHRDLTGEGFHEASRDFTASLLRRAVPCGSETERTLSAEEHYAYLLCHFAKHLLNGGIGVRQVLDLYLCRKNWQPDEAGLSLLLTELKLTEFAQRVGRLGKVWFQAAPSDPISEELGAYILQSGVFGREDRRVTDRMLRKGDGKLCYTLRRLFPPYSTMAREFHSLRKFPPLLPFFWLYRIFRGLFSRRGKLLREANALQETDRAAVRERAAFYQRCGLDIFEQKRKEAER